MSKALDLAEKALGAAEGDEAEVLVHAERSGVARFAGSVVHQPTLIDNAVVRLRIVRDGKVGWAATNRVDSEGLKEVATRAAEAADSARPDPDFPGLAPPAEYPDTAGYDEETAALAAEDQARLAASGDRGGSRIRALRLFHERRHRDRSRVLDRLAGKPGGDRRRLHLPRGVRRALRAGRADGLARGRDRPGRRGAPGC